MNQHYPLIDIIAVVVMGIICSADDFVAVYRWACHRGEWLISMGLYLNGVPSHDTLNRVFRLLDPKNFIVHAFATENQLLLGQLATNAKSNEITAIPGKIDDQKLRLFIEEHPDAYLREIAESFGVTLQAVFYACKRIKISLKKRPRTMRKEMSKKDGSS